MILCCFYGFFAGGFPSLPPSIIAEYYSDVASKSLFQVIGVNFFLETPGAILGPTLIGLVYDETGSYEAGSYITAGFMILGLVILSTIPTTESWEMMIQSKMNEEEEVDVNVNTINSKL